MSFLRNETLLNVYKVMQNMSSEISQQLQDDCDVQETNIILHGLPLDVYALVNHQEAAKDIWDRVELLMKGTELSYQEHECRLYNLFDKFDSVQGETLYEYYWRFSQHYSSSTPSHYSQSTTTINFPQPFISQPGIQQSQTKFPQLDFGLVVPIFQLGEDPIDYINKAMEFLSALASRGNYAAGQAKAVKCYNFLGERAYGERVHSAKEAKKFCMAENLDSYDSDCDDISSAKAVLMANISSYNSDVLSEESQDAGFRDTNSLAPNDLLVLSLVEQITDHVANLDKKNQTNKVEINTLKETLSNQIKEKEYLSTTLTVFKTESKEKESKYIDKEIILKNQNKELENILSMKNELRKLKGKNIVNTAVSKPSATIALGMFKPDIELISHRFKNNRDAHEVTENQEKDKIGSKPDKNRKCGEA
nr:hypothetical protein [Tanacetum cinerariifolium]